MPRHADGDRIYVAGDDRAARGTCRSDGKNSRTTAHIQNTSWTATLQQPMERYEAALCGAVVTAAEGLTGFDLYGDTVGRPAMPVVAAVDEEAAGQDRRQVGLRLGDPIEILDLDLWSQVSAKPILVRCSFGRENA